MHLFGSAVFWFVDVVVYHAVVEEFCKISLEFIRKGATSRSIFKGAAEKLGVPPDVVEHGVEGLANLFTQASRHLLNEIDFIDSLLVLSFPEELNNRLKDFYLANRSEIRTLLADMSMQLPEYRSLDWRLDVQVASRSMRQQTQPVYILKLELSGTESGSIMLQSDLSNLKFLTKELENALNESKTGYFSRIMRNVK